MDFLGHTAESVETTVFENESRTVLDTLKIRYAAASSGAEISRMQQENVSVRGWRYGVPRARFYSSAPTGNRLYFAIDARVRHRPDMPLRDI